jgi:hypothetical protein
MKSASFFHKCHFIYTGSNNKYICIEQSCHKIHICEPGLCKEGIISEKGEIVCQFTGLVLEQQEKMTFSYNEDPHWKIVKFKPEKKKRKTLGSQYTIADKHKIKKIAEKTIMNLFYGKCRLKINNDLKVEINKRIVQELNKYIQKCKEEKNYINFTTCIEIMTNINLHYTKYKILSENTLEIKKIIFYISEIWDNVILSFYGSSNLFKKILDAPSRPNAEYIVLGILFLMKIGHRIKGIDVIPYISFVAENLPREKDLKWFGYEIQRLKPAKDLVLKFFEEAVVLNLSLNNEYNEIKMNEKDIDFNQPEPIQFKPVSRGKFVRFVKKNI